MRYRARTASRQKWSVLSFGGAVVAGARTGPADTRLPGTREEGGVSMVFRIVARLLLLALLVAPGKALAQTSMGAVSGTVKDSTGAVVPGATVTLTNQETNIRGERVTNESGYFTFVNVRPGTYTLTVELTGFSKAQLSAFVVGVNETVARNVTLKVGATTEVIEVTAQSELIQGSTSELGHVVEEKVIKGVPLQGRNFTQLLLLSPGVNPVSTAQGSGANGADSTGVGSAEGASGIAGGFITNASIMGQQNRSKIYYVDGIVNTSVRAGSYVALPDIDSLQEFKVQSHGDKAEFGGVLGGVINMTSKSGSNRFRGNVWGQFRDEKFVARDSYRDLRAGQPIEPPAFSQSQFGANLGGPIVKDKTFFYASYDGWRYDETVQVRHIAPVSEAWLSGDFSRMGPLQRVIYDPLTTRVVNGRTVRDPFPGNIIPANRISPTMQAFLRAYMLKPNLTGGQVVNNFNFEDFRDQYQNSNAVQVRLDHHFSAKDNIFFRWTERRNKAHLPIGDLHFREPESTNRNFGGGWFHSFSPNMILEMRGGLATQPTEDAPLQHPSGFAPQQGLALPQLNRFTGYIVSGLNSAPWNLPGDIGVQGPRERGNPNWNVAADLTWLRGNHNFKAGFQMLRISRLQTNQFGQIFFSSEATRDPNNTANTGDPLASALLGIPTQVRGFVPEVGSIDFHTSTLSGYVQDQWAIKPTLTLSLGVRYDYVTRAIGHGNTFQSGPDLETGQWLLALEQAPPVCATVSNQPPCLPAPLGQIPNSQFLRVTGEKNSILPPITDNIGPRVGLAWQINPKTVLRTGYSLMWDSMVSRSQYGQHQFETWGWPQTSGFDTATINSTGSPIQTLESLQNLGFGVPRSEPWASTGFFNDPRRKNAYSHQWHLELQRQFGRNTMIGVAYVGSYNGRMDFAGKAFAPKVAAIDATGRRLTAAERDQLRPWPHITSTATYDNDIGMSKYNSFQFKAQQRFSADVTSMFSYTWSRTIDTSSGWFGVENGIGGNRVVQNYWDKENARGPAGYDIPHIVTWATIWELPFGRDKKWLNRGPASWILGNWQLNWMLLARSGQPMTIAALGDPANLGFSNYARASFVPGQDPKLDNPTPDRWFNTAAFTVPVNSFGNTPRGVLRAPSFWNVDMGLQKNVPFGKDREFQIRLEAFNVFNHINEGNPNVDVGNANFGRITSMQSRPRQLQLGLRLVF
jgi:outer membrane receptor protein involved in Fe transport